MVLCHGGPISIPDDAAYVLSRARNCDGFYGASSMDRLRPKSPSRSKSAVLLRSSADRAWRMLEISRAAFDGHTRVTAIVAGTTRAQVNSSHAFDGYCIRYSMSLQS
jgi:hypothetical protein